MNDPYFFGYGSLVNRATHSYPDARPATLRGWRRAWVGTPSYHTVLLTGVRAEGHSIQGLIAAVPGHDWAALDAREQGYDRVATGGGVTHDLDRPADIAVYAVPAERMVPGTGQMILLSYLDVVVQGFLQVFGEAGVQGFFDTTDGWETPIFDDRTDPRYPRHQRLSSSERALVDDHLQRIGARLRTRGETALPNGL